MNAAICIRQARRAAGLTQRELAQRAGTSQATISAYESGRKEPTLATADRVLAAAGARLTPTPVGYRLVQVSHDELERRGRILGQVLGLAEALPFRRARELAYPRLPR